MKIVFGVLLFILFSFQMMGQDLKQNISAHDPVMAKQGDTYYLFCTGQGIATWSSKDLKNWKSEKPVFAAPPQWAKQAIPSFKVHPVFLITKNLSFFSDVHS